MNNIFNQLSNVEILALTIIGEARGEPVEGQIAVGCVIRNRLHSNPTKYNTYRDVCFAPKQFSCWNEGNPNRALLVEIAEKMIEVGIKDINLLQCIWVAHGIFNWQIKDNTKGADHYMTTSLFNSDKRPSWAKIPKTMPNEIGNHTFLNV